MDRDAQAENDAVPWERHSNRDIVLVAIDAGASMRSDGEAPLLTALRATANLLEGKLVSAPHDHVGIVFWNTAASRMLTESKSGFRPGMIEYRRTRQVDVPDTYSLLELIRAAEADPGLLEREYAPAAAQTSIASALANAMHLLTTASRAGTRRIFFVTNQDDPFPASREHEQRACIDAVKDCFRRGIDLEPFFMSTGRAFDINAFYADVIGEYDDGIVDDAARPWRLRVMQDQNMSKRGAWDAGPKFAELAQHGEGRAGLKNSVFELNIDLGEVDSGHWLISVKGYSLIAERGRDMPLRVSSLGREDPDDLDEIVARQELFDAATGEVLDRESVQNVFLLGSANGVRVPITEEALREARTGGHVPGITLVGFADAATLRLRDNIKHAYFLYPSDLRHAGSKRTFAALLQSLLTKRKYALGLFMARSDSVPCYVAIVPQAEEVDDGGNQLVPPGMNMIPLPYADDVREEPAPAQVQLSPEQLGAAEALVRSYTRKEPFNPDVYANPSLRHHYGALKAAALGRAVPEYVDSIVPEYATIAEFASGGAANHVQIIPKSERASALTAADIDKVHSLHRDGLLGKVRACLQLTVTELRDISTHYGLSRAGRKPDLLAALDAFLRTRGASPGTAP